MENTGENQYEPIDKIINAVLKERLDTATSDTMALLRDVAVASLEHGYASGYENGFDDAIANLKAWEKCADDLIDYAHEFVHQLSLWGKGYDRNDKQIKLAEDAIAEYNRLKNNL
jgi:hypothetical protein